MKKHSPIVFFIACLSTFLIFNVSCSPNSKTETINELLSYYHERGMFNGCALIAEHGNKIYSKALGYIDYETKEKLNTDTAFYLGSLAKQFTAMAIMMLKEQKQLNYDDSLSYYFPEFPSYAKKITVRHLLTHTAGIANYTGFDINKTGLTNKDVFNFLVSRETPEFEPGTEYSYSNGGYVLLAMIVEKVSGLSYPVFLKQRIFSPLKMDRSEVFNESSQPISNRAVGFTVYGDKNDYNVFTYGPGGIFSTTEDLFKWDKALYTETLVKRETMVEAFTPNKLLDNSVTDYGFGWAIKEDENGKTVLHTGSRNGYIAYIMRQLDNGNTIILLTNNGFETIAQFGGIINALKNILNEKEYKLPPIPVSLALLDTINNEDINAAVKKYHESMENNKDLYAIDEDQLTQLGYHFLENKKVNEAIEVFKINVEAFPEGYNTYDSLGEAYMANNNYDLARENIKKSLELNPDNTHALDMLKLLDEKQK